MSGCAGVPSQDNLSYNDGKIAFSTTYGIPSDQKAVVPSVTWDNASTSDPIGNLMAWKELVRNRTGVESTSGGDVSRRSSSRRCRTRSSRSCFGCEPVLRVEQHVRYRAGDGALSQATDMSSPCMTLRIGPVRSVAPHHEQPVHRRAGHLPVPRVRPRSRTTRAGTTAWGSATSCPRRTRRATGLPGSMSGSRSGVTRGVTTRAPASRRSRCCGPLRFCSPPESSRKAAVMADTKYYRAVAGVTHGLSHYSAGSVFVGDED